MKQKLRISFNSPAVIGFALLSLAVLGADYLSAGAANRLLFTVYRCRFNSVPAFLRLFCHVLGHSGWEHYSGNIILMLIIGPQLEERYGSWPLLACMAVTALVTGLAQCLLFPATRALCGASGIVFMMIIMASMGGMRSGKVPLTLILVAAFYLCSELRSALLFNDNISQLSHVIGGICGGALGFALSD